MPESLNSPLIGSRAYVQLALNIGKNAEVVQLFNFVPLYHGPFYRGRVENIRAVIKGKNGLSSHSIKATAHSIKATAQL